MCYGECLNPETTRNPCQAEMKGEQVLSHVDQGDFIYGTAKSDNSRPRRRTTCSADMPSRKTFF